MLRIAALVLAAATAFPAFADYCYYNPATQAYECYPTYYPPVTYYRRYYPTSTYYYFDYYNRPYYNRYYYPGGFGLNFDIVIPLHHHHHHHR